MTLHENIKNQIKEAMRAKDELRLNTLRGLNALFMNEILMTKAPTAGEFLVDDRATALIRRSVKQRQDSIRQFEIGKRPDLAEKEKLELEILETFLPKGASLEEIKAVAVRHIDEMKKVGAVDAKAVGKLTGTIMKEMAGRADGNDVKRVIEELVVSN